MFILQLLNLYDDVFGSFLRSHMPKWIDAENCGSNILYWIPKWTFSPIKFRRGRKSIKAFVFIYRETAGGAVKSTVALNIEFAYLSKNKRETVSYCRAEGGRTKQKKKLSSAQICLHTMTKHIFSFLLLRISFKFRIYGKVHLPPFRDRYFDWRFGMVIPLGVMGKKTFYCFFHSSKEFKSFKVYGGIDVRQKFQLFCEVLGQQTRELKKLSFDQKTDQ